MKKWQVFLSVSFLVLLTQGSTFAETSVDISNNSNGSNSSVNISNTVNSTSTNTSSSTTKTNIRIETNGKVKTYESDNAGSVHIESDDGTAKVDINNNNVKGAATQNTVTPSGTFDEKNATSEAAKNTNKAAEKVKKIKETQKNFFERLEAYLKDLFSKFPFKL